MPKFVILWTDGAIWLLIVALIAYTVTVLRNPQLAANWAKVFRDAPALASSLVLALCLLVTLLDSVHFRPRLPPSPTATVAENAAPAYASSTRSLLDQVLWELIQSRESTYSRPLSYLGFTKESLIVNGEVQRVAPRLQFGGQHLADPETQWLGDVAAKAGRGALFGAVFALLLSAALLLGISRAQACRWPRSGRSFARGPRPYPGMSRWPRCGYCAC